MKRIVQPSWLAEHLKDSDVRIIDCRFQLGSPDVGWTAYETEHIPGALYFHLEKDLSKEKEEHSGRHPLPNVDAFVEKLENAGITNESNLVVYDDQDGMMAARCVWYLLYLGFENVSLLDGGYTSWKKQGNPVTSDIPTYGKGKIDVSLQTDFVAGVQDVQKVVNKVNESPVYLIDSREHVRYLGKQEPIDKKAGHIPGAINYFWKEIVGNDHKWKSPDVLAERFQSIPKDAEIIVYCGSGVSACPNVLALQELGYKHVRLYVGSWSDWITYPENEVETGVTT